MQRILISKDLFFITKVREVAVHTGTELTVVKNPKALEGVVIGEPANTVVMIDLEKPGVGLEEIVGHFAAAVRSGARCIGFFSHVHEETALQAKKVGIERVIPRSQFVKVLPELLSY
jgi:hypothetical protein